MRIYQEATIEDDEYHTHKFTYKVPEIEAKRSEDYLLKNFKKITKAKNNPHPYYYSGYQYRDGKLHYMFKRLV